MEAQLDVDRLVVDAVLQGALLKVGKEPVHLLSVGVGDEVGLQPQLLAGFEVDEEVRPGREVEVELEVGVVGVEKDDFVVVMAEVAQGVEEGFLLVVADEGVGEYDDERAPMELLGDEVQGFGDRGGALGQASGVEGLEEAVEVGEEVLLVEARGADGGGEVDLRGEEGEAEGVALAVEQLQQDGRGVGGEGYLVGFQRVGMALEGQEHGG